VTVELDELVERLREWADVHEKGAAFLEDDDPELALESLEEVELLRQAADELERRA
jgi:hypothetical protein